MKRTDIKHMLFSDKGVRLIWLITLAAVMYAVSVGGISAVYWHTYEKMMTIWAVTDENILYAPHWTQFLYSWSGVFVRLIQNALLFCSGIWLVKLSLGQTVKPTPFGRGMHRWSRGALTGTACLSFMWVFLLAIGSVRLGWRIGKPAFSESTAALLVTTFANSIGECTFFYGGVWNCMKKRLPIWAACVGMACLSMLMTLTTGDLLPMTLINRALMALICCALTETAGTVCAAGFRFAWSFFDQAVLGFAGAAAALYETYPVNLYWLNGGNSGILNGWLVTLVLCALLSILLKAPLSSMVRHLQSRIGKSPT